jgi:hypothetical protein
MPTDMPNNAERDESVSRPSGEGLCAATAAKRQPHEKRGKGPPRGAMGPADRAGDACTTKRSWRNHGHAMMGSRSSPRSAAASRSATREANGTDCSGKDNDTCRSLTKRGRCRCLGATKQSEAGRLAPPSRQVAPRLEVVREDVGEEEDSAVADGGARSARRPARPASRAGSHSRAHTGNTGTSTRTGHRDHSHTLFSTLRTHHSRQHSATSISPKV